MGVSVFVMPLSTWLAGEFRTVWGADRGDGGAPVRTTRPPEEARGYVEAFRSRLEQFVPGRLSWDESGPPRAATAFSVDGFFLPFLEARRRSYRTRLSLLAALEPPQIWIPARFEHALHLSPPWNPDLKVAVVSAPALHEELNRLLGLFEEEDRPDLEETRRVADQLRSLASLSIEHRAPAIVEG